MTATIRGAICACLVSLPIIGNSSEVDAGQVLGYGSNQYGMISNVPAGNNFQRVSGYETHGLALRSDGSLVGWGDNSFSQQILPAGSFSDIATGVGTSYAIDISGNITAWGFGGFGQLAGVPSGTFTKITAGRFHATALRSDGTAIAWGISGGTPSGTFQDVSSGLDWSLGLRTDGTLYTWGNNSGIYGLNNVPAGNNFVAVAAGSFHGVALRNDGSLAAWGDSSLNALNVPAGNDFIAIAAGQYHSLALRSNGTVVGWGLDDFTQVSGIQPGSYTWISAGNRESFLIGSIPSPASMSILAMGGVLVSRRRRS